MVSFRAKRPGSRADTSAASSDGGAWTHRFQEFIDEMAVAGMAEVQLGKLATERAASADVKAFGQMMVTDHSKAGDDLKQVASQLKVQPPTQLDPKHRDLAERLSKLQGAAFDREYTGRDRARAPEVLGMLRAQSAGADAAGAPGGGKGSRRYPMGHQGVADRSTTSRARARATEEGGEIGSVVDAWTSIATRALRQR